jgi:endonuclease YncB( thermonuclease family)
MTGSPGARLRIGLDIDPYGRTVATCSVGGTDVGRWLVRNGYAVAYRDFGDDYVATRPRRRGPCAHLGGRVHRAVAVAPFADDARDDPPNGRQSRLADECW